MLYVFVFEYRYMCKYTHYTIHGLSSVECRLLAKGDFFFLLFIVISFHPPNNYVALYWNLKGKSPFEDFPLPLKIRPIWIIFWFPTNCTIPLFHHPIFSPPLTSYFWVYPKAGWEHDDGNQILNTLNNKADF